MRLLVLGASGMLGHALWQHLSLRFRDTFALVRRPRKDYPRFALLSKGRRVIAGVDVVDFAATKKVLRRIKPAVILNCTGITKRDQEVNNISRAIAVNSLFPHNLAAWADDNRAKVIQFSTDCVFDGVSGHYTEESPTNACDIYGRTKALGELREGNVLTLRSSFIGPELDGHGELLEWFLAQKGPVKGFRRAIYSGLTTLELSRLVERIIVDHPDARGLYNVSSDPITKYDLLVSIKQEMGLKTEIVPDDTFSCDRTLDSTRFRREFNYCPPAWSKMIYELASELNNRRKQ